MQVRKRSGTLTPVSNEGTTHREEAGGTSPTTRTPWTMKQAALVAGKGFCMGAADIVPGVSGGTMALILGIYPRLLGAIRAVDLALFRLIGRGRLSAAARHVDALFLLSLGIGVAGALVFFTRVVGLPQLVATHPQPVYSVFFGLILMSLCVLLREVADWRFQDATWILAGALAGLALVLAVPVDTPQSARFLFASGAAAACAMILPGVSGAFVLLILNQYPRVLEAVAQLDLSVLAPLAFGAVCGLVLGSRILVWCLHRFRRPTMLLMSGIVLGSLYALWPFREPGPPRAEEPLHAMRTVPVWPESLDGGVLASFALAALAAGTVMAIDRLARRATDVG